MDRPDLARIRDELLTLEVALAARDGSGLTAGVADLVADDFIEFGASGRTWTSATVRSLLATPAVERPAIEDFAIDVLAEGVVLATYRIAAPRASNRASIWVRRGGAWQIRFHQGTSNPQPGAQPPD